MYNVIIRIKVTIRQSQKRVKWKILTKKHLIIKKYAEHITLKLNIMTEKIYVRELKVLLIKRLTR